MGYQLPDVTRLSLPDRLRLPITFDPAPLARDLAGFIQDDWTAHFVTSNYDGDWSAIGLRAPAGATHPIQMIYSDPAATTFVDTPVLARVPAMARVLAAFDCPLLAVRLMRLAPASNIKEHRDHDLAFEDGTVRLHIPVTTNPQVEFVLNGTPVTMEPGSVWYLRLSDPHRVTNGGTRDRVHLVIDATVNDWLTRLLISA